MKIKIVIPAFLLLLFFAACDSSQNKAKKETVQAEDIYICSMHPQIIEHHPGNCPICGMQLVKKNAKPLTATNIQLETLRKPTNEFVIATVPVITPVEKNINAPIKAYGTIEYDSRAASTISARVSGRIEKLYIRYRYQEISKGQKIMDIYSPEIL
ncbi:MAG TPA: heavy metal-binding domain-containing protein, partial [Puia sp.]|nr:heavy metal-binding domain-containing protein [Puia sp.]